MPTQGKILLVDDEPLVLEMFEDVFVQRGYDVVVASSASDAVSHLDRGFFDVVVCDVMMEGLDGFDVLSIARRKNTAIGVILITGAPSQADAQRAERQHAVYLAKPVGLDLMIQTVESVMEKTRAQRAAKA